MIDKILRFGARSVLAYVMAAILVWPALLSVSHATSIPDVARASIPPPDLEARSWVLMDFNTGWILAEHDADLRIEPASLSKLMTAYVVFDRLKQGALKMDDQVHVSENAWRTGGSRMFIKVNSNVSVEDLLKGLIVQSGNDAAVALAEHVAGSEPGFAELMNQYAAKLGLSNSHFQNSTGLPDSEHFTTARDLSVLAANLIRRFPDYYRIYSIREFTYNGISQPNRNKLLWRDESVDGVKTGHTNAAGYCLIGSAQRDGMRLVATIAGAKSPRYRTNAVHSLLKHGFAAYESRLLYGDTSAATEIDVYYGETDKLPVGVGRDLHVTVPRGSFDKLKAEIVVNEMELAPIVAAQPVGNLTLSYAGAVLDEYPLVALNGVPEGAWWKRLFDRARLWIR